jgi:hypothetical protein
LVSISHPDHREFRLISCYAELLHIYYLPTGSKTSTTLQLHARGLQALFVELAYALARLPLVASVVYAFNVGHKCCTTLFWGLWFLYRKFSLSLCVFPLLIDTPGTTVWLVRVAWFLTCVAWCAASLAHWVSKLVWRFGWRLFEKAIPLEGAGAANERESIHVSHSTPSEEGGDDSPSPSFTSSDGDSSPGYLSEEDTIDENATGLATPAALASISTSALLTVVSGAFGPQQPGFVLPVIQLDKATFESLSKGFDEPGRDWDMRRARPGSARRRLH